MVLLCAVDGKGDVLWTLFYATIEGVRVDNSDACEVVCKVQPGVDYSDRSRARSELGRSALLHLRPNWYQCDDLGSNDAQGTGLPFIWTRSQGLSYAILEAGGDGREGESLGPSAGGILVENEPGFSFQFGRMGWINLRNARTRVTIPRAQRLITDY